MKSAPDVENEDEITGILVSAASQAAERHAQMRLVEGEKLAEDILMRADLIERLVGEIEKRSPGM